MTENFDEISIYYQLENVDKQRIEKVKTTECEKAISELMTWKEDQRQKAMQVGWNGS